MPLSLQLDYDSGIAVYRQIYRAVVDALASGQLSKDEKLPAIHHLAASLEVNPNTVARAYRELEKDGYIVGKRGVGTFAAPDLQMPETTREDILHAIFERAIAEGARHRIGADEIIRYFHSRNEA